MVLGERLRTEVDRTSVVRCLHKVLRIELDMPLFYDAASLEMRNAYETVHATPGSAGGMPPNLRSIAFTPSMQRLLALVHRCVTNREPVLLVGESGCGKTTVVQLLALLGWTKGDMVAGQDTPLVSINCHQHTETSDFLGGYRPQRRARARAKRMGAFRCVDDVLERDDMLQPILGDTWGRLQRAREDEDIAALRFACSEALAVLDEAHARSPKRARKNSNSTADSDAAADKLRAAIALLSKADAPFEWVDGPLLTAMKGGLPLLIDEISLAGDAILERLNSVLEPERSLTVTECFYDDGATGDASMEVIASETFALFATMNPGGDFGKRELSPALRSRFTEIYVPAFVDADELAALCKSKFGCGIPEDLRDELSTDMVRCWSASAAVRKGKSADPAKSGVATHALSMRDLLAWSAFIERMGAQIGHHEAFAQGKFAPRRHGGAVRASHPGGRRSRESRVHERAVQSRELRQPKAGGWVHRR